MLLGKRSRHPIKRTTSMAGMTVDVPTNAEDVVIQQTDQTHDDEDYFPNQQQRLLAMVSPPPSAVSWSSTNSHALAVDAAAPFLRSCGLCNNRLPPGQDIYMYRGDTAFCSLECRERQMKQDERKEKLKVIANSHSNKEKEDRHPHRHRHAHASNPNPNPSSNKEPALAAS